MLSVIVTLTIATPFVMSETYQKRICPSCGFISVDGTAICPNDSVELKLLPSDPLIGQIVADRYKILSQLGRGGMSVVYKAHHQFMQRFVAIKMLRAELGEDSDSLKRLEIESRAISALKHPNIVPVYDYGELEDGTPYLVMEFLEGRDLKHLIDEKAPMNYREALPIFIAVCDGLAHAHKNGIIHRDIKPSNILLLQDEDHETPVIVDFGIAKMIDLNGDELHKLTATGQVFGSPLYMSPEQCKAKKPDARSDIYAVGCSLYQLLTGKLPIQGNTLVDTMVKHIQDNPKPFTEVLGDNDIPTRVELSVFKALEKEPDHRFQAMEEFSSALSSCLESAKKTGSDVVPVPTPEPEAKLSREPNTAESGRYGAIAIIVLFVVAAAVLVTNFFPSVIENPKVDSVSESQLSSGGLSSPGKKARTNSREAQVAPNREKEKVASVSIVPSVVVPAAPAKPDQEKVVKPVESGVIGVRPDSVRKPQAVRSALKSAVALLNDTAVRQLAGSGWSYNQFPFQNRQELAGLEAIQESGSGAGTIYVCQLLSEGMELNRVAERAYRQLQARNRALRIKRAAGGFYPPGSSGGNQRVWLEILEYMKNSNRSNQVDKNPRTFVIYYNKGDSVGALQLVPSASSVNSSALQLARELCRQAFSF